MSTYLDVLENLKNVPDSRISNLGQLLLDLHGSASARFKQLDDRIDALERRINDEFQG